MALVHAGNVWNPCLRLLRLRGYELRMDCGQYEDDDSTNSFSAHKNGFDFYADNPVELLGLTAFHDHHSPAEDVPYWWMVDGDDIYDELLDIALTTSFHELRDRDPGLWAKTVRDAVECTEETPPHDRLGISADLLADVLRNPPFSDT